LILRDIEISHKQHQHTKNNLVINWTMKSHLFWVLHLDSYGHQTIQSQKTPNHMYHRGSHPWRLPSFQVEVK